MVSKLSLSISKLIAKWQGFEDEKYVAKSELFGYNMGMVSTLPDQAKKYFWGDDLNSLSWPKHKKYIIQTLLERGDPKSLHWMFRNVTKEEVKSMLPNLRLQPKSYNFWKIYLS